MRLVSLKIENVRNLRPLNLEPSLGVNLIYGNNGTGKTSLLEAIYILSLGRSFRTHNTKRVISNSSQFLSVFGLIDKGKNQIVPVGVEKNLSGDTRIRLAGDNAKIADAASLLPVTILNNDTFLLLTAGPKIRRQFLDWGLFHVKHNFIELWREQQQALKQRNAAIRTGRTKSEIKTWDEPLIKTTEAITAMRKEYLELFLPQFRSILESILEVDKLEMTFYQGWSRDDSYQAILESHLNRDIELGYSYYGSHRADIQITRDKHPLCDMLSRGQQKLFVWAMKLAQGTILKELTNKNCIYLLDDLPSELDSQRRESIAAILKKLDAQIFVTALETGQIDFLMDEKAKMFHVKHGVVSLNS